MGAMVTVATTARGSGGGAVRSSRGRRLQQEIEAGKRGIRCGSSQRSRREAQTARGGVGDGVRSLAILVQRRRGRARWRGSTASGDAWLVEVEEEVVEDLPDMATGLGVAVERGGSERGGDGVRWLHARETKEGRSTRESEREVQGVAWRCERRPGGGGGS